MNEKEVLDNILETDHELSDTVQGLYESTLIMSKAFGIETAKKLVYWMIDAGFNDLGYQAVKFREGLSDEQYLSPFVVKKLND